MLVVKSVAANSGDVSKSERWGCLCHQGLYGGRACARFEDERRAQLEGIAVLSEMHLKRFPPGLAP